ncbi:conserved hypothetical protein [Candidatus Desulfosporosinus infrequens]|uniref:Uncharacterized protein n=1 Tax=Candidatus Desulfosporosinus infrequens TaxID=2043169 RepID=A0A2U3KTC2_9FIRM|nr:conserved hypothetical protein [Candidatus Desulfosporosinus infrequens]
MINTWLPIIGIIVVAFIVWKFLGSIVKGIITLALIVVVVMIGINLVNGTPLINPFTSKTQAQVQLQTGNQEVNTILQKIKGVNPTQIETFLKDSQSELGKYSLDIKQAFAKLNQRQ